MEVRSMKIVKKRCEFCRKWFLPDPRTFRTQKCCSDSECRKKRKAMADKNWRKNNPRYNDYRKEKIKSWAKEYPDYWKKYRKEHPVYVEKDNKRRSTRHKKGKIAAKQDAISQIFVEKLKSIQENRANYAAKQDAIDRRIDSLLESLIWKESSAKQVNMDKRR